jgi:hypothetical protein
MSAPDPRRDELKNLEARMAELQERRRQIEAAGSEDELATLTARPVFRTWTGAAAPFPKGRRKSRQPPPEPTLADFGYTVEMRQRALERIRQRLATENYELIFEQYCEATFKSFMRRVEEWRRQQKQRGT